MSDGEKCQAWQEGEGEERWNTSCGRSILVDGWPSDAHIKFCCYCGKPIDEVPWTEEADEAAEEAV